MLKDKKLDFEKMQLFDQFELVFDVLWIQKILTQYRWHTGAEKVYRRRARTATTFQTGKLEKDATNLVASYSSTRLSDETYSVLRKEVE